MSEPSRNPCQLGAILAEIRDAEATADDPRRNRAVYALRLLYGVSLVEPCANYGPYRPTDGDYANAAALADSL